VETLLFIKLRLKIQKRNKVISKNADFCVAAKFKNPHLPQEAGFKILLFIEIIIKKDLSEFFRKVSGSP
jgi:hypothetical protein